MGWVAVYPLLGSPSASLADNGCHHAVRARGSPSPLSGHQIPHLVQATKHQQLQNPTWCCLDGSIPDASPHKWSSAWDMVHYYQKEGAKQATHTIQSKPGSPIQILAIVHPEGTTWHTGDVHIDENWTAKIQSAKEKGINTQCCLYMGFGGRGRGGPKEGELSEGVGGTFCRLTTLSTATHRELLDCTYSRAHNFKEEWEGGQGPFRMEWWWWGVGAGKGISFREKGGVLLHCACTARY